MAENSGDLSLGYMMGQSDGGGGNSGGGFGGFGGDGIWAILLFAMIFGYGRNGSGFGGGSGGGYEGGCYHPWATQADVRAAVDQQTLISKIDQQTYGLSDVFTSLNTNLNNNFRGFDNAVCTLGYQNQQGFSTLGYQMKDCCCETQRDIERNTTQGIMNTNSIQKQISDCCCDMEKMNMQNRFDAQTYNCDTLRAIDKLGDRIIDFMSTEKMQTLRDENQALRLAASQARQNQYLVNELRPCPVPAYSVPAPFYFGNGACGCGCGCG